MLRTISRSLLILTAVLLLLGVPTKARGIWKSNKRRSLNKNKEPSETPSSYPSFSPTRVPKSSKETENKDKEDELEEDDQVVTSAPAATIARIVPVPTATPTRMPAVVFLPTGSPTISSISFSAAQTPADEIASVLATPQPSPGPTPGPTSGPTSGPTVAPTIAPTLEPTGFPSVNPTMEPTAEPTLAPTQSPTESPSLKPSRSPSRKPSARPSATPSIKPTSSPSVPPSTAPSSSPTLTRHEVRLNEFNILLTSDQEPVNIGELETSLENYMLETMPFDNLLRVQLDVVEGDSVTDSLGTFISTSVRFGGTATFTSFLPPSDQIRKGQNFVLVEQAKDALQTALQNNTALAHATVRDVSFDRIESTRPFDELDAANKKDSKIFGLGMISIISAVSVVAVLSVLGGILVVRLRSVEKQYAQKSNKKITNSDDDDDEDPMVFPIKKKTLKEEVGHGCSSLVSGKVSLGSNRMYSLPETLDDIVIRPMFSIDDEDDDAYLTMDEELHDPYDSL